jgi:hypothetical protein
MKLLNIGGHFEDFLMHCENSQWLPIIYPQDKRSRFFSFRGDRPDGSSIRNIYSDPEYETIFYYPKYFNLLPRAVDAGKDMNLSDSVLVLANFEQYTPSYLQLIAYMKECGIIYNVREIKIRAPCLKKKTGVQYTVPAKKTVFDFNPKGLNKIIFDKELNVYGVDDNGKPFVQGRFRLGENGCWGVYGRNGKRFKNSKFRP